MFRHFRGREGLRAWGPGELFGGSHDCHVQVVLPGVWPAVSCICTDNGPTVTMSLSFTTRTFLTGGNALSCWPNPACGSSGTALPSAKPSAPEALETTVAPLARCSAAIPAAWS